MRDGCKLRNVVRHDDARNPQSLIHLLNEAHDHAARNGIKADEGLIVNKKLRIHDDGTRERHAPRHTAGELPRAQIGRAAQAYRLQLRQHERAQQRLGQIRMLAHRKGNILEHIEIGQERAILEQHSHALAHSEYLG